MNYDVWRWVVFTVGVFGWLWYAVIETRECERRDHKVICVVFGILPPTVLLGALAVHLFSQCF
ncbi:MAG: hypothetical protein AAB447_02225 [Patescibacteria group bacterium]